MLKFIAHRFEEILGSALLFVMVSIAFANVITRYCIKLSFSWTEELTVNLFVWVVLLGTSVAFRRQTHLGVSLFYDKMPPALRRVCYLFFVLSTVCFFGAVCYLGYIEVIDEIDLEVTTESLAIPVWWYTIATPAFSALIIVRVLQRAVEDFRNGRI